jgi:hypothetical protein
MQALQAQPQTSAELATRFGVSDRHIRRILKTLPVEAIRKGREFIYVVVAAASSPTTTITAPSGTAPDCGHMSAKMSEIGRGESGETIADMISDNRGHGKIQTSHQRHRNAKRTASSSVPAAIGPQEGPGVAPTPSCAESGTNLCPQYYATFERDMIRFVLVDKPFHDLIMAKADRWTVRRTHGNNQTWVYPIPALTLQLGVRDTVVFHSAEPGDMSVIADWIRDNFPEYADMASLLARVRNPQNLSGEEITVVIKRPETIQAIRTSIGKIWEGGQFNLFRPGTGVPGLKIYESNSTMRVEFIVSDHKTGVTAIDMREELMRLMPRIHHSPGLFWEFVQRHYYAIGHPQYIDTGGHDYIASMEMVTGRFTEIMKEFAARIPVIPPQPEESRLKEIEAAIEEFEIGVELDDILRAFQRTLKLEDRATKVFLAAWVIWSKRNCKGRVLKEEIAGLLQKAGEPLTVAEIADAVEELKTARLMDHDPRLEIRFSPVGQALAKKITAKKEGIQ